MHTQAIELLAGRLCVRHAYRATLGAEQLLEAQRPSEDILCLICAYEELVVAAQHVAQAAQPASSPCSQ